MTRAKDISKILTDADISGTLDATGIVTANAGIKVDNITIDGTEIDLSSGDLTLDVAGDIILDAGGQNIIFKDDGTEFGQIYQSSNHLHIFSSINNADIKIQGNDAGATITAIELDMSDAGSAYFNHDINLPDNGKLQLGASQDLQIYHNSSSGNSFIADEGTGGIILSSGSFTFQNQSRDETHAVMTVNGSVDLYHNNVKKFETTSSGVTVTGGVTTTTASSIEGGVVFNEASADVDFRVESNGNVNMLVVNGGTDSVQIGTNIDLITGAAVLTVNGQVEIATAAGTQCLDMVRGDAGLLQNFRKQGGSSVGNITISASATAFNTSSDYRLKENVVTSWDATTRLKQLKPSRFNFIADADTTVDGFLAHEVQSVVPEAITGTHNEVEVWEDGEELPDGVSVGDNKLDADGNTIPVMQGIDQSKLVPLLVKTIQELEARIVALENA